MDNNCDNASRPQIRENSANKPNLSKGKNSFLNSKKIRNKWIIIEKQTDFIGFLIKNLI